MTIVSTQPWNSRRSQWRAMINYILNQVGIDTIIKWLRWEIVIPRIFLEPVGIGYDYEHGGFDAVFLGWDASPDPSYKEFYDKICFPPSDNWYWMEDGPPTSGKFSDTVYPNITAMWKDIYTTLNSTKRISLLKEYQHWYHTHVPTLIIPQAQILWAMNSNLEGFDLFYGIRQQICNWTGIGNSTDVVFSLYEDLNLNPHIYDGYRTDYHNSLIYSNTHVALSRRRGEYNLTHAYPWLAKNWTHSPDYKTWIVNLREGNRWSDGQNITADDVVFTYKAILNKTTQSSNRDMLLSILGNTTGNIVANSDYQVTFSLPIAYPYVETELFGIFILPQHQLSVIPYSDWKIHGTNTGTIPIVASGPYMMHSYTDHTTIELFINPYYNQTTMGHNVTVCGGGNWIPNPEITNVSYHNAYYESTSDIIDNLLNGTYDIIDKNLGFYSDVQLINDSNKARILLGYEWKYEEMGFNHYSSIWGMNPHNPREMYPPPEPYLWFLTIFPWFFPVVGFPIVCAGILVLLSRKK